MTQVADNEQPDLFHRKGFFLWSQVDERITVDELPKSPLMDAFLDDVDLVEMTVTSSNMGFSYTFTKPYPGWRRDKSKPEAHGIL